MNTMAVLNEDLSLDELLAQSPLGEYLELVDNPAAQQLGRALAQVWLEFEQTLCQIPIVASIENKTITQVQYRSYLLNMRQQVSQGGRWITRAASSMENSHVLLRNALIRHAAAEHEDFTMLEDDYVKAGGEQALLHTTPLNIGSEALSAFIMQEASKPNPVGIFGATFIIEGLGSHKAALWSECIQSTLGIDESKVKFLHYHGLADEDHYDNLVKVLSSPFINEQTAIDVRRIAKVVGRLYVLQLEQLDNY